MNSIKKYSIGARTALKLIQSPVVKIASLNDSIREYKDKEFCSNIFIQDKAVQNFNKENVWYLDLGELAKNPRESILTLVEAVQNVRCQNVEFLDYLSTYDVFVLRKT